MSEQARVRLLADSTLSGARLVPPSPLASAPNQVETWLDALVRTIPGGANWIKLWLPPPPHGKRWTGDDVVKYALSLAQLYGTIGAVQDGKSEILATQLPDGPAQSIKDALKLQPVYLLKRRGTRTFAGKWGSGNEEPNRDWTGKRVY